MVQVRKKDGESPEALLRRFTRKIQQSGLIIRAKKGQHYQKPKTQEQMREDAVRKSKIRGKIEYLKKIGKFDEEFAKGKSRSRRS